jgi:hypothetical protein
LGDGLDAMPTFGCLTVLAKPLHDAPMMMASNRDEATKTFG